MVFSLIPSDFVASFLCHIIALSCHKQTNPSCGPVDRPYISRHSLLLHDPLN
jgi:hypothetical protein